MGESLKRSVIEATVLDGAIGKEQNHANLMFVFVIVSRCKGDHCDILGQRQVVEPTV